MTCNKLLKTAQAIGHLLVLTRFMCLKTRNISGIFFKRFILIFISRRYMTNNTLTPNKVILRYVSIYFSPPEDVINVYNTVDRYKIEMTTSNIHNKLLNVVFRKFLCDETKNGLIKLILNNINI